MIAPEFRRHREQDRTAVIMVGPERWGGAKRGKNNNREKKKDKKRKKAELGKRKTQAAGPRPSLRPPIDARYCNAILGKMRGKRQGERGGGKKRGKGQETIDADDVSENRMGGKFFFFFHFSPKFFFCLRNFSLRCGKERERREGWG